MEIALKLLAFVALVAALAIGPEIFKKRHQER
jgi:hypothetical protein